MAQRLGGRDPIGQKVKQGWPEDENPWREVIGVVADVKTDELNENPSIQVFMPSGQEPQNGMALVVRAAGDPLSLTTAVEAAVHEIDADVAVVQPRTMEQWMSASYSTQRYATSLLEVFAGIALLLAAVGIYGVTSYTVAQRTSEIGVRVALGASRVHVFRLVWTRAMTPSMIGLALGARQRAGGIAELRRHAIGLDQEVGARREVLRAQEVGSIAKVAAGAVHDLALAQIDAARAHHSGNGSYRAAADERRRATACREIPRHGC